MANDASSGVGNSSAQTVDAHVLREWEAPQAKRGGGMERSGSLCGRVAAPRETMYGRQCGSIGKQLCAAGRSWHREAAVRGGQKPAGVQLFCVTAVVPTVGAELAFWQAYGGYKVFQSLELERCELHVFAHYVYHLFVLCAVAVHILLKYLL